ncbi:hypothetical protein [Microbacterium hydrocarbonoxydans]|uniref:hypothetical protein n=1 Tax=Microbacterium hydrocarbonoxydans TaxID=273678 RepID=UPI003D988AF8
MNGTEERPLSAQLATAVLLIAEFDEQINEWNRMGAKRRARTARGRDLASRIDGLHVGKAKWLKRAEEIRQRMADADQV